MESELGGMEGVAEDHDCPREREAVAGAGCNEACGLHIKMSPRSGVPKLQDLMSDDLR